MKKIPNLVEFCRKTGILNICEKTKNVTYGPYGHLILNQIKNEWLRANLNKFETSFLVDCVNLLDDENNQFDFRYFINSLKTTFESKKLPISLLNIVMSCKTRSSESTLEYSREMFDKEPNIFAECKDTLTHLKAFHFCNDEQLESDEFTDSLSFWQRERKNWWLKLFSCPENVFSTTQSDNSTLNNINIQYKLADEKTSKWLENIKHLDRCSEENKSLELVSKTFAGSDFILKNTKQFIITQTTAQNVLENVLHDSVQYRRCKSDILTNYAPSVKGEEKIVFRLNFRLAPFKACILYEKLKNNAKDSKNCFKVADDLRKLFNYHQINVFMLPFDPESETLQEKYEKLDELGLPFTILLKTPSILKEGVCYIRNRDTTLEEHLHISQVVNQFNSISNALNY